ncbi:LOW QUALITY PROTEIN: protein C12orf4 homolog [Cydia pomonella]|uniref:LOW QUALITY PROTEIN: protein C12orf4 homolog n=1 Tax=Cydia pomonella TaxID=82600 RepID=UPI002ADDEB57|nr:LOW QUALITY PROTEIN: protein C12orf4 homolog [Cydia pomonella]
MQTKMTGEVVEHTTKTFKFSYPTCTNEDVFFHLEVPVQIPGARSGGRELVQRAMAMFHVPVYLEDELNEKLAQFIAEESKKFHDERDAQLLAALRGGEGGGNLEGGAEGAVKRWERRFKEHVREYAEQKDTSDEEVFAAMYHKLVHSPALETVLRAEAGYAAEVRAATAARDADVKQLTQRQTEEMEEALRNLNVTTTEEQINALAVRQFEEQALAAARWGSQLDALAHAQRAQHRAQLARALRQQAPPPSSPLSPLPAPARGGGGSKAAADMEESFTIHLGSQLKQTHNIRIVAMDVEDMFDTSGDSSWDGPRLQTALALYSGELSGAVVLCAAGGAAPPSPPAALLHAARAAPDHHFPPLDEQLRTVAERAAEPIEKRNAARHERSVAEAAGGGAPGAGGGAPGAGGGAPRARRGPATGDVFVTRHSNLPDAHVVFHLVINDDARESGEMTSRHPAILGLRSVLQGASNNDVTSLALPLLLRHELTEEMTAAWIVRRAELVLKCAKGFMLEAAGGGGAQLRTLTLRAPRGLAPPVFAALRALLPAVFRISTPLKIKPRE